MTSYLFLDALCTCRSHLKNFTTNTKFDGSENSMLNISFQLLINLYAAVRMQYFYRYKNSVRIVHVYLTWIIVSASSETDYAIIQT